MHPGNILTDIRTIAHDLFKNTPDAIIVTDVHDTIQLVNPAFEILFGYRQKEIAGSQSKHLYADKSQFESIHQLCEVSKKASTMGFYEYDIKFRKQSGQILTTQAIVGPLFDKANNFIGCITIIRDTSKQLRSETILKQRERELVSIINNVPFMLYLKDVKHLRYVYINQAGEKLIGQSCDWLLGRTVNEILPPEQALRITASDREVITSGDSLDINEENIHTAHGDRVFRTRKAVIWSDEDLPLYLLGLSEDITECKQAIEELQGRRDQLEDIANSLPGGLYQVHVDKDGHTRLPYVSDGLRLMLDLAPDADITDIDTLLGCVEAADLPIIEETARAAFGGPSPLEAEFRVHTASGIRWLHAHARPRQQTDGTILFNGIVTDVSERHQMEERLLTEKKQILISYQLKQQALKQTCFLQQKNINELIEHVHSATSLTEQNQTNRQLQAIARTNDELLKLIENLQDPDQTIEPGKDDTFLESVNDAGEFTTGTATEAADILYIEDNPTNLKLLQSIFAREEGFVLHTAMTPAEGLELASHLLPDAILLDINLPGMDGYELLSELRADPNLATKPIIAVTAQTMAWDIEKGRQAGFFAHLTKPIEIPQLMQTLQKALQE